MRLALKAIVVSLLLTLPAMAEDGVASWYGDPQAIACGKGRFDPEALTAAHPSLPCWTVVLVTSHVTGKSVVVTINDRGPAKRTGRAIDLSRAAARQLGMIDAGLARVTIQPIK